MLFFISHPLILAMFVMSLLQKLHLHPVATFEFSISLLGRITTLLTHSFGLDAKLFTFVVTLVFFFCSISLILSQTIYDFFPGEKCGTRGKSGCVFLAIFPTPTNSLDTFYFPLTPQNDTDDETGTLQFPCHAGLSPLSGRGLGNPFFRTCTWR